MTRFAESTTVTPERSQAEISETLRRYGANGFMFGWEDDKAMIAFKAHGRHIRFVLALPSPSDPEFKRTEGGRARTDKAVVTKAYEQEVRRRWRSLALAIKAKLEAVSTGIASFEEEFLAHIVLPDNSTVGDRVIAEVEAAYSSGVAAPRLLAIGAGDQ